MSKPMPPNHSSLNNPGTGMPGLEKYERFVDELQLAQKAKRDAESSLTELVGKQANAQKSLDKLDELIKDAEVQLLRLRQERNQTKDEMVQTAKEIEDQRSKVLTLSRRAQKATEAREYLKKAVDIFRSDSSSPPVPGPAGNGKESGTADQQPGAVGEQPKTMDNGKEPETADNGERPETAGNGEPSATMVSGKRPRTAGKQLKPAGKQKPVGKRLKTVDNGKEPVDKEGNQSMCEAIVVSDSDVPSRSPSPPSRGGSPAPSVPPRSVSPPGSRSSTPKLIRSPGYRAGRPRSRLRSHSSSPGNDGDQRTDVSPVTGKFSPQRVSPPANNGPIADVNPKDVVDFFKNFIIFIYHIVNNERTGKVGDTDTRFCYQFDVPHIGLLRLAKYVNWAVYSRSTVAEIRYSEQVGGKCQYKVIVPKFKQSDSDDILTQVKELMDHFLRVARRKDCTTGMIQEIITKYITARRGGNWKWNLPCPPRGEIDDLSDDSWAIENPIQFLIRLREMRFPKKMYRPNHWPAGALEKFREAYGYNNGNPGSSKGAVPDGDE